MRMQTISVILGVVLLGIGANDATAKEDWVCAPSELIQHIAGISDDAQQDRYKWIGMCYSRPEGECEEGWGDGMCKRVDAYDTVAPLSNNACSCTSEDNKDTICMHYNHVHRVDKCAPQPEERVSADGKECPFIYTAADCEIEALAKGLRIGGEGSDFESDYGIKGCFAHDSGAWEGIAFFGTGGDAADMEAEVKPSRAYRVTGPMRLLSRCSEIIEEAIDIVEKAEAIDDGKECPFIYTAADCEIAAYSKGLRIGGEGYDFVIENPIDTKGCFAYDGGAFEGIAFFGTSGWRPDMEAEVLPHRAYRVLPGWCSEIIEEAIDIVEKAEAIDIVEKAIEDCKEFYAADPRRIRTQYDGKYLGVKERKVALKKHLYACGDSRAYQYFLDGAHPDCFIATYDWEPAWRSDNVHPNDYSKPYLYCDGIKSWLVYMLWRASELDNRRAKEVKSCEEYNKLWRARGGKYLASIKDCNKDRTWVLGGKERDHYIKNITCGPEGSATHGPGEGPTGCLSVKDDGNAGVRFYIGSRYGANYEEWSELPWSGANHFDFIDAFILDGSSSRGHSELLHGVYKMP